MSIARKMRRRVLVPGNPKCSECGGKPELGVTSPGGGGRTLLYCRPCARKVSRELGLRDLQRQLGEDEPS